MASQSFQKTENQWFVKVWKPFIIFGLSVLLIPVIFALWLFFDPQQRKARYASNRIALVKPGMSSEQVAGILSEPDTTYYRTENGDSLLILAYPEAFAAPDHVRIVFKNDSAMGVEYNY